MFRASRTSVSFNAIYAILFFEMGTTTMFVLWHFLHTAIVWPLVTTYSTPLYRRIKLPFSIIPRRVLQLEHLHSDFMFLASIFIPHKTFQFLLNLHSQNTSSDIMWGTTSVQLNPRGGATLLEWRTETKIASRTQNREDKS